MEILGTLALPPSAEHLSLVKYLLILLYLIHIPFMSMLMGGASFSVFFSLLDKAQPKSLYHRFARELIDTFAYRKSVGLILGVVPLFTLIFVYSQFLHGADIRIYSMLLGTAIMATIGLVLIYFYQSTFENRNRHFLAHVGSGGLGVLLLIGAYLAFTSAVSLVSDPEKWNIVRHPSQMLFSWNVVAKYLLFTMNAFAITGGGILFFFCRWRELDSESDAEYATFVKRFGAGVGLAFVVIQPLFLLWQLATLPKVALSVAVFTWTGVIFLLLLLLSVALYGVLRTNASAHATRIFMLFLLMFLVVFVSESTSRESAVQEHTRLVVTRAEEAEQELLLARGIEGGGTADEQRGESVFKQRCVACHQFDKRLVGPPMNAALVKYEGKPDALAAFIRSPSKVDPAYPAMPKLGLKEIDIEAVCNYLLAQVSEQPE